MKKYLGLFTLLVSFSSFGASTNSVLVLRAIVPTTVKVEVRMDKTGPKAVFHTNSRLHPSSLPKAIFKKTNTHYLVSITHP